MVAWQSTQPQRQPTPKHRQQVRDQRSVGDEATRLRPADERRIVRGSWAAASWLVIAGRQPLGGLRRFVAEGLLSAKGRNRYR